jgi:hypothetical protein
MNNYFVRYIADTIFSLKHRKEHVKGLFGGFFIKFTDIELFVYESLEKIGDKFVFKGISFDSYVTASTVERAQSKMQNAVSNTLDIFSFISLSPWTDLSLISTYEANVNIKIRKSNYYFYNSKEVEIIKSIRPLDDLSVLKEILDKLGENNFRSNIFASLYQLNKGLQSNTDVDEFLSYWVAIEYLAHSLNEKSGYKKIERYYECPSCGKPLSKCQHCGDELSKKTLSPGNFKRVEEIALNKLNITRKEFQKIINTRAIIIHGGKWNNLKGANKYKDLIRCLLVYCVGDLLELNDKSLNIILVKLPNIRNKTTSKVSLRYETTLSGLDNLPKLGEITKQPSVILIENKKLEIVINEDGSINTGDTNTYLHQAEKGVVFNNITYNVYSHKLSGIKKIEISPPLIFKNSINNNN